MYKILLYVIFAFVLSIGVGHIASAESIQDQWIDELHLCENRNNVEKILDTNGKYSYGEVMFQLDTFHDFGKKYMIIPDEFTKEESLLLISNPHVQRSIAKEMLDDGLWRHWYTCAIKVTKKLGKYPQLSG